MTRIPNFDEVAIDSIIDQIRETRTFIQALAHRGRLIDIDTLLAVAEAEARRLTIGLTVQRFAGPPSIASLAPAGNGTHLAPASVAPRLM